MTKFTIPQATLLPMIRAAAAMIPATKAIRPELEGATLRVASGKLEVLASSDHDTVSTSTAVESDGDAIVLVHAKNLLERVAALGPGDVAITLTDKGIELRRGKTKLPQADMRPESWKPVSVEPKGGTARSEAKAVANLLDRVTPLLGNDNTRPVVCGVYLNFTGDTLIASTANNPKNYARMRIPCKCLTPFVALIHSHAVVQLSKLLSSVESEVSIGLDGSKLVFAANNVIYVASTMDHESFPTSALDQIFAAARETKATCKRAALLRAVAILGTHDVGIRLRQVDSGIRLFAVDSHGQVAEEFVPAEGRVVQMSFGKDILATTLKAFDSDEIELAAGRAIPEWGMSFTTPNSTDTVVIAPRSPDAFDAAPTQEEAA